MCFSGKGRESVEETHPEIGFEGITPTQAPSSTCQAVVGCDRGVAAALLEARRMGQDSLQGRHPTCRVQWRECILERIGKYCPQTIIRRLTDILHEVVGF